MPGQIEPDALTCLAMRCPFYQNKVGFANEPMQQDSFYNYTCVEAWDHIAHVLRWQGSFTWLCIANAHAA
jgi:hypothetical protein